MAGKRPYRILRPARVELRSAALRYEQERPGLGQRFTLAVDEAIKDVIAHPRRWSLMHSIPEELGVHRRLVDGFPFAVAYRILADDLPEILAIMHGSREPGYFKGRTK